MTPRQRLFALEYIACDFSVELAAKRCDVEVADARRWLREKAMKEEVARALERAAVRIFALKDRVVEKYFDLVDRCMDDPDRYGTALQALKELSKIGGMVTDGSGNSGSTPALAGIQVNIGRGPNDVLAGHPGQHSPAEALPGRSDGAG